MHGLNHNTFRGWREVRWWEGERGCMRDKERKRRRGGDSSKHMHVYTLKVLSRLF
jgi:hypothetical protein